MSVSPNLIREHKIDLNKIKAIAMDIDGILTDGTLIPLANGDILRIMDAKDAFAIRVAANKGFITAIMSGGDTEALRKRCLHMNIKEENLFLGCRGKLSVFNRFCKNNGLLPSEVAYFGDDIPDTQVLKDCGCGIVPCDAVEEAKAAADIVTAKAGGKGCVREGIEMIMKAQGKWTFDENRYDLLY